MPKAYAKLPSKARTQVQFGLAVRAFRVERGMTQQALAEVAELHTNYVSSVERGERNISLHNIAKLAYAFGISAAQLMARIDGLK